MSPTTFRYLRYAYFLLALIPFQAIAVQDGIDPVVQQIITDISSTRIEQRIRKLVSFETRHTLSQTDSDTRGIGAARRWIEAELRSCAQASGGRLQVSTQEWLEPTSRRVSRPTKLVNVLATLPGDSPSSRERLLIVSGHYDSINSDISDSLGVAPGANDDASGTAVSMELACVMAKHHFDATLIFMTVPGEEQGLLGAAHFAREARKQGLQIEAMITNDIVGSATGDAGQHDSKRLRLFADGFDPLLRMLVQGQTGQAPDPTEQATNQAFRSQLQSIAMAGGGADLPTHQLGRHLKASAERYAVDSAARPLLTRRRSHSLPGTGLRGCAIYRTL